MGCKMTDDKCREAFEAWIGERSAPLAITQSIDGRYARAWVEDCWQGWRAAWKESPPVSREGWLTEEEIDSVAQHTAQTWAVELVALCDMARAALRLHSERSALFTQLRAAIDTVSRGNV